RLLREEAIVGELDVLGRELPPVDRGFVVPVNSTTQVEDDRGVVRFFPPLSQIGLHRERPRRHRGAHLVTDELAVDEGERVVRLEVQGGGGVEGGCMEPAAARYPAALGWSLRPEPARHQERSRGQCSSDRHARTKHVTTGHPGYAVRLTNRPLHERPPPPRP